jgi:PAS domain S-box-containing protein
MEVPSPDATSDNWAGVFASDPGAVTAIRVAARAFCESHGASAQTREDIALAVTEAAANAAVHAFVGREPGTIRLTLRALAGAIAVNVIDDGNGMGPRPDSPGLGLGLPTIAHLTEHFDVRAASGGGTELAMLFAAPGVAGRAGELSAEHAALLIEVAAIADTDGWPNVGAERLAGLLVGAFADAAIVDVATDGEHVERLAVRVRHDDDGEHERWLRVRGAGESARTSPTRAVMRTGRSRVLDLEQLPDPRDREHARGMRVRWWVSVPLRRSEQTHGALGLGFEAEGAPDDALVALCELIAERAAGALAHHRVIAELQRSRVRLERILGALGEAVTVHDQGGRMAYANEAAARLLGAASVEEVLAASPDELAQRFAITHEDGSAVALEELPGYRVLSGEASPTLITRSVHLASGREFWLQTTASRLDEDGPLAVNIVRDITDAKLAEQRQRFLARAGELLLSPVEPAATLERVARLTVGALADWCAIDLLREGRLERVALVHVDPAREPFGRDFHARYPPDLDADDGMAAVIRDGVPQLYRDITDPMLVAGAGDDPGRLHALRELGMRSVMIVPLSVGDRTTGALTLVTAESRRVFDGDDLHFAADLARRAALAIEHARLRTGE